ncbi:MAG: hypothetical protein WBX27_05605 [Specibacter sp.]
MAGTNAAGPDGPAAAHPRNARGAETLSAAAHIGDADFTKVDYS